MLQLRVWVLKIRTPEAPMLCVYVCVCIGVFLCVSARQMSKKVAELHLSVHAGRWASQRWKTIRERSLLIEVGIRTKIIIRKVALEASTTHLLTNGRGGDE